MIFSGQCRQVRSFLHLVIHTSKEVLRKNEFWFKPIKTTTSAGEDGERVLALMAKTESVASIGYSRCEADNIERITTVWAFNLNREDHDRVHKYIIQLYGLGVNNEVGVK